MLDVLRRTLAQKDVNKYHNIKFYAFSNIIKHVINNYKKYTGDSIWNFM